MRTLGLIGGMSWMSTLPYYRALNEAVHARLGGLHSAPVILYSVDFAPIARWQAAGEWGAAGDALARVAVILEEAGAEGLMLCTNTMHQVAPAITAAVRIPLLHIVDPTARAIRAAGIDCVGLLGTRFTMEGAFYRERLAGLGVSALVPDPDGRAEIHRIIYEELCQGRLRPESAQRFRAEMQALAARGAGGIIFGCTEIGLLVGAADAPVPVFDTTALHAAHAADWMIDAQRPPG